MSVQSEINRIKTNIANAYDELETKGATMPQIENSSNLSTTIASIPSGKETVEWKDINYIDYDGTLLYSFEKGTTWSVPSLPTHDGLVAIAWNYPKALIMNYDGEVNVGVTYDTDDGSCRIYIDTQNSDRQDITLHLRQTVANTVNIDWGDGSPVEGGYSQAGAGNIIVTHTYPAEGKYMIKLFATSGTGKILLGGTTATTSLFGNHTTTDTYAANFVYKMEIGSDVSKINNYALQNLSNLETIVIGTDVEIGNYILQNCVKLKHLTIPYGNSESVIGTYMANGCTSLESTTLPFDLKILSSNTFISCPSLLHVTVPIESTTLSGNAFRNCSNIKKITIPSDVTTIGTYAFAYCTSLKKASIKSTNITSIPTYLFQNNFTLTELNLNNEITEFGTYAFGGCRGLTKFVLPASLSTISANAMSNCYGLKYIDGRNCRSVPTLSNVNALLNLPTDCKIVVPDSLYDSWVSATNWTTYSNRIVKSSEFVIP